MPFYEYQCDACGDVHEAFQKMSDPPIEICMKCGGAMRKVLHPVAIHFKGSGFYTTDSGKAKDLKRDEGYRYLERERYRRAESGDPVATRALEADLKKPSSSSGASKDKKAASSS